MTEAATTGTQTVENALLVLAPEGEGQLVAAERARIDQIKQTLDLTSATSITGFGTGSEKRIADFADSVLGQVMSRDLGPVHDQLHDLRTVLTGVNPGGLKEPDSWFGRLFFNIKNEITKFAEGWRSASARIDSIADSLEDQVEEIRLGIVTLDKLFDQNQANFKDLALHIVGARETLQHARETLIPQAEDVAQAKRDDPDALGFAQKARDLKDAVERLDRKILNLEKSKAIAHTSMPAIRQVQQTGLMIIEEMQAALNHAIPALKNTMVIRIEQLRQAHGIKSLNAMTDFTNQQIKDMADALEDNTTAIHEQSKRGIADVEAIVYGIDKVIATIDKIDGLEAEARKAREEGRQKLSAASQQLTETLAGDAQGA